MQYFIYIHKTFIKFYLAYNILNTLYSIGKVLIYTVETKIAVLIFQNCCGLYADNLYRNSFV